MDVSLPFIWGVTSFPRGFLKEVPRLQTLGQVVWFTQGSGNPGTGMPRWELRLEWGNRSRQRRHGIIKVKAFRGGPCRSKGAGPMGCQLKFKVNRQAASACISSSSIQVWRRFAHVSKWSGMGILGTKNASHVASPHVVGNVQHVKINRTLWVGVKLRYHEFGGRQRDAHKNSKASSRPARNTLVAL